MSYLLNRATLRVYGGKEAAQNLKPEAWAYFNRLLMAKKLITLSGISTPKKRLVLERLEKNLRFLENCEAIRIYKGKIYYVTQEIDFGEEGKGSIDIVATMANALAQAKGSSQDQLVQKLEDNKRELFFEVASFTNIPAVATLPHKAKEILFHPLLRLLATEKAARRTLVKLNERGAEAERERIMEAHPETRRNILFIEREMAKARRTPLDEIKEAFDPRTGEPYTLEVQPADSFSLLAAREGKKRQLVPVISDVHLEATPHAKTGDLLRFYQMVVNLRSPAVVHNGDYYDFFVWRATFERILEENQLVASAVDRMLAVLQIFGNHDLALKAMTKDRGKLGPNVYVPSSGTHYERHTYFEHGHQSDRHNLEGKNRGRFIVKLGTYLAQTTLFKVLSPNFMKWMEIGGRLWFSLRTHFNRSGKDEWRKYKVDALGDHVSEVEKGLEDKFTTENPLIYVRGHDHGAGYWFTIQDIVGSIASRLEGRVRYCTTGSWKGDEAYFLLLDYSHPNRTFAYPFMWQPTHDQLVAFKADSKG